MKQVEFTKQKETQWQLLRDVLADPALAKEHDLPKMIRQLSHDLAIAKSRLYSPSLVNYLNQLMLMGHQQLYKPTNRFFAPLWKFIKFDLPRSLEDLRQYVVWAHVLFYGVALIAMVITLIDPDFIRNVISNAQVVDIEEMYDPLSKHYGKERESDSDFLMFGYYIFNNISIAFQSFVGGIILGFGALYVLLFNALYLGVISGHIVNIDYGSTFFSFVITHGAFELTAIVLSGAAGSVIGLNLLRPGSYSRVDALKMSGKKALPLMFAAFLMLVIAAFIEAFWSSSQTIPHEVKYAVGGFCWIWVLLYLFRRVKHAN
jgi:uncharacterized membrane protein SpoIIM required for sporulation